MRSKWQDVANKALGGNASPSLPLAGQRSEATRPQAIESDVSVPLRQALISGGLLMLCALNEVLLFWLLPWYVGLAAIPVWLVILAIWFGLMYFNRRLLWRVESVYNVDIDGDKHVGPPEPTRVVRLELHKSDREHEQFKFEDIPIPKKSGYAGLIVFAREIVRGAATFAERPATEYGYSRSEWEALRDKFRERGWAEWNHPSEPRQGVTLTDEGREVLALMAEQGMPCTGV